MPRTGRPRLDAREHAKVTTTLPVLPSLELDVDREGDGDDDLPANALAAEKSILQALAGQHYEAADVLFWAFTPFTDAAHLCLYLAATLDRCEGSDLAEELEDIWRLGDDAVFDAFDCYRDRLGFTEWPSTPFCHLASLVDIGRRHLNAERRAARRFAEAAD